MSLLSRFRKSPEKVDTPANLPALNVYLLMKHLERYSTDRLNSAMQAAWHKPYDPLTFFGMNLDDEHGLVKFGDMFIPIYFQDRRLNYTELQELMIPDWAMHNAFCRVSFVIGDGLHTAEVRHQFTGLVSLLCLELVNDQTVGFLFAEDKSFVRRDDLTKQAIFENKSFDPATIASA